MRISKSKGRCKASIPVRFLGLKYLYQPSDIQQELEIRDHINHRAKLL